MSTLIETRRLKKYYPVLGGVLRRKMAEVKAVDGVDIKIMKGECFGLVGESGCGKTTLGKAILMLHSPTAGSIYFDAPNASLEEIHEIEDTKKEIEDLQRTGSKDAQRLEELKKKLNLHRLRELQKKYDVVTYRGAMLKKMRRRMQVVYQDPTTSLDPRMLIKDIVQEPLIAQGLARGQNARKRVLEILYKVGLTERHLYRYPHEFSGGQRQRIAVARALVTNPDFIVLDEPTSAVDVSVRAQMLNLFQDLQKDLGLTYLFVSHDLSIVECIAQRVAVMYLGKIVELAQTEDLYRKPLHPYAQALFASIPIPDPTVHRTRVMLTGEVPSPVNPPAGCRFHPRCPIATQICSKEIPELRDVGNGHLVACHLVH